MLPFYTSHHTAAVLRHCEHCYALLLFLIFGKHAVDATGLDAYGRLIEAHIRQHGP